MLIVAIIEDQKEEADRLINCLNRYSEEQGVSFSIQLFESGLRFLDAYQPKYDIVFMDIDLPSINGLETARQLRKLDPVVALVFVTNLAQYAIKGYEFDAMDYLLKPLKYPSFALKFKKVVRRCNERHANEIAIKTSNFEVRVPSSSIIYVEISLHSITYHTEQGDYNAYGTMKQVVASLPPEEFVLCNSCYLVNLRHITKIEGYIIHLGKYELAISHPKRKKLLEALHSYYGKNI